MNNKKGSKNTNHRGDTIDMESFASGYSKGFSEASSKAKKQDKLEERLRKVFGMLMLFMSGLTLARGGIGSDTVIISGCMIATGIYLLTNWR